MAQQETITMTQKEALRYDIIQNLITGKIDGTDAAKQVNLSTRQVRRLKAKVKKNGLRGMIHGNRGKESNRKIPSEKINEIESIIKEKYHDFGPTFATEKLEENHQIVIGKEKLRLLMADLGLWRIKARKQSNQWHTWRKRKDNYGEMQQFDGSYHFWLEDRFEELCLLLSIDDATGNITHAKFDYNESIMAVFTFWTEYLAKNGLPVSIYLDKYSTYKINHKNAVDNKDMITQFQRAMNQVGIRPITAHSAEAKGRVERVFKTLQDRLVKEMRLKGVSTIKEANELLKEYIPKFNAKFAVIPNKKANLHKKTSKQLKEKLPQIFSIQDERKVNNDYTIMFKTKYFQLDQEQSTTVYKRDTVIMEEHLDGEIKINLKGYYLNYTTLSERPKKQIDIKLPAITKKKQSSWKPPVDHPWRTQLTFGNKLKIGQSNMVKERV